MVGARVFPRGRRSHAFDALRALFLEAGVFSGVPHQIFSLVPGSAISSPWMSTPMTDAWSSGKPEKPFNPWRCMLPGDYPLEVLARHRSKRSRHDVPDFGVYRAGGVLRPFARTGGQPMIEPHLIVYAGMLVVFIIAATILALCVVILACSVLVAAIALRVITHLSRLTRFVFKFTNRPRRSKPDAEGHGTASVDREANQFSSRLGTTLQSPAKVAEVGHKAIAGRNWKIPPVPTRSPRTVPAARPIQTTFRNPRGNVIRKRSLRG